MIFLVISYNIQLHAISINLFIYFLFYFFEGPQNEDIERNESSLVRKKINILHGLHKVGESLKMRKGYPYLFL